MRTRTDRSPASCWPLLIVVALLVQNPLDVAWAAGVQKKVLVLYSTRRDAQISVVGDREMPRILDQGLTEGLDFYSEYIDQARFIDPGYETAFRDFLRLKYGGQRFDLVIAIQNTAIQLFDTYGPELFPDTPMVFFTDSGAVRRTPNSTGVVIELDLRGTLVFAEALQPDLRQVFVVSGTAPGDKDYESRAREQFRSFEPRLAFTYLSGLTTKDLEGRLAALPEHSAVFYVLVDRDGAGENFHPIEYLDRVAKVANAPTYCWVDSAMDHGIVGGSLKSQSAEMDAVGRLALRVLHGESADAIPIATADLNIRQADWRQLRRWSIDETRVPAGTLIAFREPSVWDRYSRYILGAVALLLAQSALIVGLIAQGARRRKAEAQVREQEAELRTSHERIHDLAGRLLLAQEAERSRIARELHDDISQQMALLAVELQRMAGLAREGRGDSEALARGAVERVQGVTRSLRDLSHRLHPARLRLLGLVAALDGLQRELSGPDMAITFVHDGVPEVLPQDFTLCLFRIVQEALQNAIKHSRARQVSVRLVGDRDGLKLTIADDGVGFDLAEAWGRGLGLLSMSERLEPIDGTFKIDSTPGAGTRLEVVAPLPAEGAADAASA